MRIFLIIFLSIFLLFSCERKGRKKSFNHRVNSEVVNRRNHQSSQEIIKMTKIGGVYEVPIKINNHPMNFILDTGASDISISLTEARFLYKHGALLDKDILGDIRFSDATGKISIGKQINLRKVEIGNRKLYNVSASIVNNIDAPLLLGQSALSKFGTVTIDYKNQQLIIK